MKGIKFLLAFIFPLVAFGQLQSSGPISIGDLRTEAGQFGAYRLQADGTSNFSVTGNPTSLSEFYGLTAGGGSCTTILDAQFSTVSSTAACNGSITLGVYGSSDTFSEVTAVYSNNTCTNTYQSGYFSDGTLWKYWNESTQSFTSNGLCF